MFFNLDVDINEMPKIAENVVNTMYNDLIKIVNKHKNSFTQDELDNMEFWFDSLGSLPNEGRQGYEYGGMSLEAVPKDSDKQIQLLYETNVYYPGKIGRRVYIFKDTDILNDRATGGPIRNDLFNDNMQFDQLMKYLWGSDSWTNTDRREVIDKICMNLEKKFHKELNSSTDNPFNTGSTNNSFATSSDKSTEKSISENNQNSKYKLLKQADIAGIRTKRIDTCQTTKKFSFDFEPNITQKNAENEFLGDSNWINDDECYEDYQTSYDICIDPELDQVNLDKIKEAGKTYVNNLDTTLDKFTQEDPICFLGLTERQYFDVLSILFEK